MAKSWRLICISPIISAGIVAFIMIVNLITTADLSDFFGGYSNPLPTLVGTWLILTPIIAAIIWAFAWIKKS